LVRTTCFQFNYRHFEAFYKRSQQKKARRRRDFGDYFQEYKKFFSVKILNIFLSKRNSANDDLKTNKKVFKIIKLC